MHPSGESARTNSPHNGHCFLSENERNATLQSYQFKMVVSLFGRYLPFIYLCSHSCKGKNMNRFLVLFQFSILWAQLDDAFASHSVFEQTKHANNKTHTLTIRTSAEEAIKKSSLEILFRFVCARLSAHIFSFYLFIVHFYCIYELCVL